MTPEEIRKRFEDPSSFRWVPLSALRAGEYLSCIDGRHDQYIIAGPGGDLGEAIVLLSAVEKLESGRMEPERVRACIRALMDWHPRFYMHTDFAAISQLEAVLERDPKFASNLTFEAVETLLQRPPAKLRDALADYLVRPEFTGCGHLKCMLNDPRAYGVRLELVQEILRAFLHQMWDGAPSAQFTVLEGIHDEEAVLSIEVDGEADGSLFVPAVLQSARLPRVFVLHQPARQFLRRSFLGVLEHHGLMHDQPDELVMARCAALADQQLAATVGALAADLPKFRVHFGESRVPVCIPD